MDIRKSEKLFRYLEKIHVRYTELTRLLTLSENLANPKKYRDLSKELSSLKTLDARYGEYKKTFDEFQGAQTLLAGNDDPELKTMAQEELERLGLSLAEQEDEIEVLMVADVDEEKRNVFLEIRAGAGGDEASLFASDLLRMYMRLAERKKWKAEVISTTYSSIGGIKEIILYLQGANVYRQLRFESGVHRVQRVPVTEASGRIHTSTVTVAVLPEVADVEIDINPKDIRIDTYAASGHGGQHVNKTESAIRITHFPSGIVVTCQDEKSQHKNKDKAMKVLKARLFEFEKDRQQQSIAEDRRSQVGMGERAEKIRTYNFPQNRVTDHRINGRNFNVEFIIDGDLQELLDLLFENHTRSLIDEKIKSLIA